MNDKLISKSNFIRQIITQDLKNKKHNEVVTRFPPEPNGYLHVGHAKSICLNFGLAQDFNGRCLLRFDDTNPIKEEEAYVKGIVEDVKWLGFNWDKKTHSSDYYQALYDYAIILIEKNLAYVDDFDMEKIRAYRGTLTEPGIESPSRSRSIAENLDLFTRMKKGEFTDGTYVLRAKIDMKSGNLNLRDPVMYRIRHVSHQQTGSTWCIYPMYDYAHPISDALENITHSICTLEFQDHRALYDWFINNLELKSQPQQIEFARLNVSHTITSKRKLKTLVDEGYVNGWDDPRMPTLRGMRERGYPARAIRDFCEIIGVAKSESVIDMSILEECVRAELNNTAKRAMCIINPLKVIIENVTEDLMLNAYNHPNYKEMGSREIPFSREIYIEADDFMEKASENFFRLSLNNEVRLRNSYVLRANKIIYNSDGSIKELHASIDTETLGKNPQGRKVKGVIHWVSVNHAVPVDIIQYDRLFLDENPGQDENFLQYLNPNSRTLVKGYAEKSLEKAKPHEVFQFERLGYYKKTGDKFPTFQRVVALKDTSKG